MGWCGICIDTATSHTKLNSRRLCKLLPSFVELLLIKRFTCYIFICIYLFLISFFFAALGVDYGSFPLATPSSRPPHTIVWHFANFVFDIALSNFPAKEIGRYKNGHCSGEHMLGPFTTSVPRSEWSSQDLKFQESVDAIREGCRIGLRKIWPGSFSWYNLIFITWQSIILHCPDIFVTGAFSSWLPGPQLVGCLIWLYERKALGFIWESVSHRVERLYRSLETTVLYTRSFFPADRLACLRSRFSFWKTCSASPSRRRTPGAGFSNLVYKASYNLEDTCGSWMQQWPCCRGLLSFYLHSQNDSIWKRHPGETTKDPACVAASRAGN